MQYLCYTVVTLKGADNMTIGQRIKARRLELCMNAETLAEKVGVSAATIYRYEKGDILRVNSDILLPIADALLTTPAFLMGWEEDENKKQLRCNRKMSDTINLSTDERRLIAAYRAADERAREDALNTLLNHPAVKEKESRA